MPPQIGDRWPTSEDAVELGGALQGETEVTGRRGSAGRRHGAANLKPAIIDNAARLAAAIAKQRRGSLMSADAATGAGKGQQCSGQYTLDKAHSTDGQDAVTSTCESTNKCHQTRRLASADAPNKMAIIYDLD